MKIKRVVFFGTPDFSVETLKAICEAGYEIAAVVTTPDKPAGRGLKLRESEVKLFAVEHHLPLLQPESLKDVKLHQQLIDLKPDVQIVVAFKKLPVEVFTIPPMGTINLHASLLPYYRGAAPINWAIINGEKETGVTTFFINERIDEGHILLQKKINIYDHDTAATLYNNLKILGAALTVETLNKLSENSISSIPQPSVPNDVKKIAPKIQKEDCKIKWDKSGKDIINFIRGLSPYPCAYTELIYNSGEKSFLKVYSAVFEVCITEKPSGSIVTDGKTFLKVVCIDGLVSLLNVQLAGKVRMEISSFLRGFQQIQEISFC